jgi:hypothetical protein
MYISAPALAHTQDVPTLSKETTMTQLAIRPFRINIPEEALVDLRRRVAATRWPDRETVTTYDAHCAFMKLPS